MTHVNVNQENYECVFTPKLKVWLKLERCDEKVGSLCVEKFRCDGKLESLKKKFGTKQGLYQISVMSVDLNIELY